MLSTRRKSSALSGTILLLVFSNMWALPEPRASWLWNLPGHELMRLPGLISLKCSANSVKPHLPHPPTYPTNICRFQIWLAVFQIQIHSFGQFKKHALLKAHTQSPCFSYPGLARAFISAGSTDLLSFGGASVGYGGRFTVLVAGLWTGENAAGLYAYCRPHRLPINFLDK